MHFPTLAFGKRKRVVVSYIRISGNPNVESNDILQAKSINKVKTIALFEKNMKPTT